LQEHKTQPQVKMSSLKCCVLKSATQISHSDEWRSTERRFTIHPKKSCTLSDI